MNKLKKLQEPLSKDDIELRVGTVGKTKVRLLLYKTSRVVQRILDAVFGMDWKVAYRVDDKGNVVCTISLYNEERKEWISREDVGSESNIEKEKGAYSDAFKRAATLWGIGRELYEAPLISIKADIIAKDGGKGYKLEDEFFFFDAKITEYIVEEGKIIKIVISNKGETYTFSQNNNLVNTAKNDKAISILFEELQTKLEKCIDKEFLAILQKELGTNKSKLSEAQVRTLANLYKAKEIELNK